MRIRHFALGFALFSVSGHVEACSCFGPSTFCETLHPPPDMFPPEWWIPEHVVLGVKLASVEYGVDLQVIQDFRGSLGADEIIRVWGDCGFLCRTYNSWVEYGDTVLWAIKPCDMAGNTFCGASQFEEPEHYQLPVCGIYWLGYGNGQVSGPLFTEGATETVSLAAFGDLVNGCLSTGVLERTVSDTKVRFDGTDISIETGAEWSDEKHASVTDATGRVLLDVGWRGSRGGFPLPTTARGLVLVRVADGRRSFTTKLYAD